MKKLGLSGWEVPKRWKWKLGKSSKKQSIQEIKNIVASRTYTQATGWSIIFCSMATIPTADSASSISITNTLTVNDSFPASPKPCSPFGSFKWKIPWRWEVQPPTFYVNRVLLVNGEKSRQHRMGSSTLSI